MIETFKQLMNSQFQASLATLSHCVQECPETVWCERIARYPFCQVAFHTLFFADYYLGLDAESFRQQPFHVSNQELFDDYEQLEYREPVSVYEKPQIEAYLDFCREKARTTIAAETETTLAAPAKFERRNYSRAELHMVNIRHIQHHAAQLILRLRLDSDVDIPWVGAG